MHAARSIKTGSNLLTAGACRHNPNKEQTMKINLMSVENVKRIQLVNIEPKGNSIVIGGNNGQGKTSLLDSIEWLLRGARHIPGKPVRDGEDHARIVVETEKFKITRTFTGKSSQLVLASIDGAEYKSPQSLLDEWASDMTYDPVAFTRLKAKEQVDMLKKLLGLDFDAMDADRKALYEERTAVGRDLKNAEGLFASFTFTPEEEELEPVDYEKAIGNLREAEAGARHRENLIRDIHDGDGRLVELADKVSELGQAHQRDLQRLKEEYELAVQSSTTAYKEAVNATARDRDELSKSLTDMNNKLAEMPEPAIEELTGIVTNAGKINDICRKRVERDKVASDIKSCQDVVDELTNKIKAIDEEKKSLLADAKFPVDGLSFGDGMLVYNGIPFDQASMGEQIKVAIGMGMASSPELRVLLVRDGAYLDDEALKSIMEMAVEQDIQLFIERVGDGKECQVIIEDGKVAQSKD